MNAQANLATMEELVRTHHKDIAVSVLLDLRVFSAMRKIVTVIKFHHPVQSAQCAEMSQELVISAVSAEPDIKVSFSTPQNSSVAPIKPSSRQK